jgi:hypothetical protein
MVASRPEAVGRRRLTIRFIADARPLLALPFGATTLHLMPIYALPRTVKRSAAKPHTLARIWTNSASSVEVGVSENDCNSARHRVPKQAADETFDVPRRSDDFSPEKK